MSKMVATVRSNLGNTLCGMNIYYITLITDVILHIVFFLTLRSRTVIDYFFMVISFVSFIYPLQYVYDNIWLMRRDVRNILRGKALVNRKFYMNYSRTDYDEAELMDVTVSIPVYKENNDVIFTTIESSIKAVDYYVKGSNRYGNVIISDDGLAGFLGGFVTKDIIDELMSKYESDPNSLSEPERMAMERVKFYREKGIGFVARPVEGRNGLFKKASNLNYTMKLGEAVTRGADRDSLILAGGDFYQGYYENDIITRDIILLLDKDSIVNEKIIAQIAPEFTFDKKLAYIQCTTRIVNLNTNYFSHSTGAIQNFNFLMIWPEKALQGFFVPLVGHNAFLRRDALVESNYWNETKVSEDYDKAIELKKHGYHGKYADVKGCEFGELTSETFTEEASKKFRYMYGMLEMMLEGTVRNIQFSDFLTMFFNSCMYFNDISVIPIIMLCFVLYRIDILWLGFLFCCIVFIIIPAIRSFIYRDCPEFKVSLADSILGAFAFFGASPFEAYAFFKYFVGKITKRKIAFPSTPAGDTLDFKTSMKNLVAFYKSNWAVLIFYILVINWAVLLTTRISIFVNSIITFVAMFAQILLSPIILSPGLFKKGK